MAKHNCIADMCRGCLKTCSLFDDIYDSEEKKSIPILHRAKYIFPDIKFQERGSFKLCTSCKKAIMLSFQLKRMMLYTNACYEKYLKLLTSSSTDLNLHKVYIQLVKQEPHEDTTVVKDHSVNTDLNIRINNVCTITEAEYWNMDDIEINDFLQEDYLNSNFIEESGLYDLITMEENEDVTKNASATKTKSNTPCKSINSLSDSVKTDDRNSTKSSNIRRSQRIRRNSSSLTNNLAQLNYCSESEFSNSDDDADYVPSPEQENILQEDESEDSDHSSKFDNARESEDSNLEGSTKDSNVNCLNSNYSEQSNCDSAIGLKDMNQSISTENMNQSDCKKGEEVAVTDSAKSLTAFQDNLNSCVVGRQKDLVNCALNVAKIISYKRSAKSLNASIDTAVKKNLETVDAVCKNNAVNVDKSINPTTSTSTFTKLCQGKKRKKCNITEVPLNIQSKADHLNVVQVCPPKKLQKLSENFVENCNPCTKEVKVVLVDVLKYFTEANDISNKVQPSIENRAENSRSAYNISSNTNNWEVKDQTACSMALTSIPSLQKGPRLKNTPKRCTALDATTNRFNSLVSKYPPLTPINLSNRVSVIQKNVVINGSENIESITIPDEPPEIIPIINQPTNSHVRFIRPSKTFVPPAMPSSRSSSSENSVPPAKNIINSVLESDKNSTVGTVLDSLIEHFICSDGKPNSSSAPAHSQSATADPSANYPAISNVSFNDPNSVQGPLSSSSNYKQANPSETSRTQSRSLRLKDVRLAHSVSSVPNAITNLNMASAHSALHNHSSGNSHSVENYLIASKPPPYIPRYNTHMNTNAGIMPTSNSINNSLNLLNNLIDKRTSSFKKPPSYVEHMSRLSKNKKNPNQCVNENATNRNANPPKYVQRLNELLSTTARPRRWKPNSNVLKPPPINTISAAHAPALPIALSAVPSSNVFYHNWLQPQQPSNYRSSSTHATGSLEQSTNPNSQSTDIVDLTNDLTYVYDPVNLCSNNVQHNVLEAQPTHRVNLIENSSNNAVEIPNGNLSNNNFTPVPSSFNTPEINPSPTVQLNKTANVNNSNITDVSLASTDCNISNANSKNTNTLNENTNDTTVPSSVPQVTADNSSKPFSIKCVPVEHLMPRAPARCNTNSYVTNLTPTFLPIPITETQKSPSVNSITSTEGLVSNMSESQQNMKIHIEVPQLNVQHFNSININISTNNTSTVLLKDSLPVHENCEKLISANDNSLLPSMDVASIANEEKSNDNLCEIMIQSVATQETLSISNLGKNSIGFTTLSDSLNPLENTSLDNRSVDIKKNSANVKLSLQSKTVKDAIKDIAENNKVTSISVIPSESSNKVGSSSVTTETSNTLMQPLIKIGSVSQINFADIIKKHFKIRFKTVNSSNSVAEEIVKCKYCSRTFSSIGRSTIHERKEHNEMLHFRCTYRSCKKAFHDSSQLRRHKNLCHKKVLCLCCDKRLVNKIALKIHTKIYHSKRDSNVSSEF